MQRIEIFWAQIPELLRFEDKNSMAFSIETRLPFLDYKFVETCLSINNHFKIYKDGLNIFFGKIYQRNYPTKLLGEKER
jgi:asparagine synthase (glutamine-hydrolysing)